MYLYFYPACFLLTGVWTKGLTASTYSNHKMALAMGALQATVTRKQEPGLPLDNLFSSLLHEKETFSSLSHFCWEYLVSGNQSYIFIIRLAYSTVFGCSQFSKIKAQSS